MKKKESSERIIYMMEHPVIIQEEGLPMQWVHYADGRAFIGFSEAKDSEVFFCECCRKAVINYIKLRKKEGIEPKYSKERCFYYPMKSFLPIFPERFLEKFGEKDINIKEVYSSISFKQGLCHKCNQKMPTVLLKYAGYNTFMQHYGWYVDLKKLELGYLRNDVVLDTLPDELREMVAEMQIYSRIWDEYAKLPLGAPEWTEKWNEADKADKKLNKVRRRFHNIIENMVREEFGYKKVGEQWVTEKALYHIVCQLLPKSKVIFHYRSQMLEGLELDIFVPDLKIGIEYQGVQHYKPLDIFGGIEALKRTQEHDIRKKRLCYENGIELIEFYYYDEIGELLVRDRLKKYIK